MKKLILLIGLVAYGLNYASAQDSLRTKGYFFEADMGVIFCVNNTAKSLDKNIRMNLSLVNGYSFNRSFSLGVGFDLQQNVWSGRFVERFPLYAQFRYSPLKKISPVITQRIGAVFYDDIDKYDDFEVDVAGVFYGIDIGLEVPIGRRWKVNALSIGYQLYHSVVNSPLEDRGNQVSSYLSLRSGFVF